MSSDTPLISIIIPVYNTEKYLRECLDSVLAQTLPEIEVICINDGSKDRSLDILREYEAKDSRLRVIDKQNEGVSIARNTGLETARGEFIQFVDSDDFVGRNLCEEAYHKARAEDLELVVFSYDNFFGNRKIVPPRKNVLPLTDHHNRTLLLLTHTGPCSKLIKRSFLTKNGITFPADICYGEDRVFHWKVCCLVHRFGYVHDVGLYFVRNNSDSLTARKSWRYDQSFPSSDSIDDFLRANNLHDTYGHLHGYVKHRCYLATYHKMAASDDRKNAVSKIKQLLNDSNRALFKGEYRRYGIPSFILEKEMMSFYKSMDGSLLHSFFYFFFRRLVKFAQKARRHSYQFYGKRIE